MLEWTGERYVPWMEEASIGYEHLHRYVYASQFIQKKRVLDLACGEGYGSHLLAATAESVVGIDLDPVAIRHASSKYLKHNLHFKIGSITEVPIEGSSLFDVIVCFEAIEHIEDHDKLLSEVKRLLTPDGLFMVSTPNKWAYSDIPQYKNPFHVHELYFDEYRELLENYFKQVRFLGQRLYCNSNIWPLFFQENSDFSEHVIERTPNEFVLVEKGKRVPLYFIAIASDSEKKIEQRGSALIDISDALLKQKEGLIAGLTAERERLAGELNRVQTAVQAQEQALAEKAGQVAGLTAEQERLVREAATLQETLRAQQQALAGKEEQIARLAGTQEDLARELAELRSAVESYEQALRLKEVEANSFEEARGQAVREMGQLRGALSHKDAEFRELKQQTEALQQSLEVEKTAKGALETELSEVKTSLSWWWVLKYRKVKDRCLPFGAKRRRLYDALLQWLKKSRLNGDSANGCGRPALLSCDLRDSKDTAAVYSSIRGPEMEETIRSPQPTNRNPSLEVREISQPAPLKSHQASVDIVICVHNALDDVRRCLESVIRYSRMPYSLILVDDGSEDDARRYLAGFADSEGAALIRNKRAKGYTFAANQGMRRSTADYLILLNSDTMVTPNWVDRLIACAESDPRIGLVGPLSNSASWQSTPEIFDQNGGDWAINGLPEGVGVAGMGRLIEQCSACLYPRIPFLNGFCLLIKRRVIEEIGLFDEANFGKGYGEENDYCLRAGKAGWQLAVADDTYIYHAQSRSYSNERRRELKKHADLALVAKHGQLIISSGVAVCRGNRVLEGIRAQSRAMPFRKRLIEKGRCQWEGRRILFILPIAAPGGGGNVVFQEARAMRSMGVDARVVNLARYRDLIEPWYGKDTVPLAFVQDEEQIPVSFVKFDAVVATTCASVDWMQPPMPASGLPVKGYYVQDFEPYFFPENTPSFKTAWNSYTRFPDIVRVTKTEWNRDVVKEQIGVDCSVVGPSVDIDLYRPRRRQGPDWPQRPLRVAAMIRPDTPRRNATMTMEVLRELDRAHGNNIEIVLFGCRPDDPEFLALPRDFAWHNAGVMSRQELAFLFNEIDILVDFSAWQAMGLTAMEAMGCGVAVIVPERGGARSFAVHAHNSLIVDTASRESCLHTLDRLVRETELRVGLQRQAMLDICQYFPERAAYNTLAALFPACSLNKEEQPNAEASCFI